MAELLYELEISDSFFLALNGKFLLELGRVDHHFRGILIELKELFYEVGVHEIITSDDFSKDVLEIFSSTLQLLVGHFEEETFFRKGGERVKVVFKTRE